MTFQLDTSGSVIGAVSWNSQEGQMARHREIMHRRPHGETVWDDLSPFTQGYIEALAASQIVGGAHFGCLETVQGTLHEIAFSDLAPETLARIIADCDARFSGWFERCRADGVWFWKTRQRGEQPDFPPLTVQLGDAGKVRFA